MHSARKTVITRGPSMPAITSGMRSSRRWPSRAITSFAALSTEPTLRYTVLGATPSSRAMSLSDVLARPWREMHSTWRRAPGRATPAAAPAGSRPASGKVMTSASVACTVAKNKVDLCIRASGRGTAGGPGAGLERGAGWTSCESASTSLSTAASGARRHPSGRRARAESWASPTSGSATTSCSPRRRGTRRPTSTIRSSPWRGPRRRPRRSGSAPASSSPRSTTRSGLPTRRHRSMR